MSAKPNPMDSEVLAQHTKVGITAFASPDTGYQRTTHPDTRWFTQAGIGLFFHWGISSVSGQGDLSWGMMKRPPDFTRKQAEVHGIYAVQTVVPPSTYWQQAENFLCQNYDPERWLSAAAEAGVRYVVLTTKHHDGFCLWPSAYGELSTRNYLQGRDLVGEFVAAARKCGLKIGFYYSPPDWHYHRHRMSFGYGNEKPFLDINHQPYEIPDLSPDEQASFAASYRQLVNGHVGELLTRYGKIDVLWFDGRMPEGALSLAEIRQLQPHILINTRGYGYGDFDTPECRFPSQRLTPGWWEYCHVFADGAWGYLSHESYKPIGWFLGEYAKTRAWDGNFLGNVAPNARGEMPETYYLRLRQLRDWMAVHAEAVVGTSGGTWPETSNVPLTRKSQRIYAHLDWMFDEEVIISGLTRPHSVQLLHKQVEVPFHFHDGVLRFSLPNPWRTNTLDIVAIDLE